MPEESSALAEHLAEHPRLIGALFTILLLLVQAGAVAANGASANAGP